ncbi:LiaI-LiaF-like domain-containing protein [Anoxynatronum sibiricum]|uniref:DUF5668 domain-containing protein n=1 Tax=Anoxynatronum sibiricum TaxID=210623 RepID=A0ABU9VR20_9CLOT
MRGRRQWLPGGLLIVLGTILLLNNLGYTTISIGWLIRQFWPVALILWGVSFLVGRKGTGELVTGLVLVALGVTMLGNRLGWFVFEMKRMWAFLWPLALIIIGINFLRGPNVTGRSNTAFMSGIEKTKASWELEDGTYWAIMGGISLDLNKARLESGKEYQLSCNVLMGGIEIIVPEEATVYCEGSVMLGGLEMLGEETGGIYASLAAERVAAESHAPLIRIHCRAAMGGIEIS